MGQRGPTPEPSKFKLLKGNPGHRPINEDEPKPRVSPDVPEPPDWLQPYAKAKWNDVAPHLHRVGLLTVLDLTTWAVYCQSYARWRSAEESMGENGNTIVLRDKDGKTRAVSRAPQAIVAQAALADMNRFGSQFGLSPSSRIGIKGGQVLTVDPIKAARERLRRDPQDRPPSARKDERHDL